MVLGFPGKTYYNMAYGELGRIPLENYIKKYSYRVLGKDVG